MWRLSLEDIAVRYGNKAVLNGVSAQFSGGEMTGVIGSNGVGKSTLLKAVAGLLPHTGSALLREDSGETGTRRDIAYVPQLGALNTRLTVFEMVLLGLIGSLGWRVTPEQTAQVEEILREMGLLAIARQPFSTLSGGQKQLCTMAQSLIGRPKVLLLDEPTSALDLRHQLIVMDLAQAYTRRTGAITLFVAHDLTLTSRYGDRILLLSGGKIKALDVPQKVLCPDLLEEAYQVGVSLQDTPMGFLSVIPTKPLEQTKGE